MSDELKARADAICDRLDSDDPDFDDCEEAVSVIRDQRAEIERLRGGSVPVATVTKLPSRNGNPKVEWANGAAVRVGMGLYTAPPAPVVPSTHWSKPAARQWAEAVCTKSASPADRFLAVAAHVAGQRYALGESPESTLSHPDGEGAEVAPAPAVPDGWREVAEHLRHCRTCSETDVDNCDEGAKLWMLAATPGVKL